MFAYHFCPSHTPLTTPTVEYLAIFSQLVSFHDPELFVHLDEIGFQPQVGDCSLCLLVMKY